MTAKAVLKFGSEVWVLKKRDEQRLEAAQMKFLRHLLGITKLDKEKNQSIRKITKAQNIVKEIKQHQQMWLQHVQRMGTDRLPKWLQYVQRMGTNRLPKWLQHIQRMGTDYQSRHCAIHQKDEGT